MKYILESSFLVVAMLLGIACGYATCLWTQDAYRQRPNQTDQSLDDILVAILIGGVAGFA